MNDANAVGSSGGRGARRPRGEASDEDAGQHRLDARRPRPATRRVFDALASLPGDATWRDIVNAVCVLVTRYLPFDATIRHPERESRRRGRARASPHGARPTLRRRRDGDIAHDDACSCVIAHGLRASRKTQSFIKTTSESRRKRRDGDAAERRGTARRRRRRGDVRLFSFHFNSFPIHARTRNPFFPIQPLWMNGTSSPRSFAMRALATIPLRTILSFQLGAPRLKAPRGGISTSATNEIAEFLRA